MWSDAARQASIAARRAHGATHQSGIMRALTKDRFVNAVPPGSKRDFLVKQAARWSASGLEKAAVVAAGGGAVGVAGIMAANYTKWGGDLARQFGPKIKRFVQAHRSKSKRK